MRADENPDLLQGGEEIRHRLHDIHIHDATTLVAVGRLRGAT